MVLTEKDFKELDVSFMPVSFLGGSLSEEVYEQRRDRTTKQQLNDLLVSPQYREWVKKSSSSCAGGWKTEAGIVILGLLVSGLLFLPTFWASISGPLQHLAESQSNLASPNSNEGVMAATAAQELSAKLREKEVELARELDKNARLELSLWSVEHQNKYLWTEIPSLTDNLLPEDNTTAFTDHSPQAPLPRPRTPQELLLPVLAGAAALIAVVAAFVLRATYRSRVQAAKAEARELQQRIENALQAQEAAEGQIAAVQNSMADKAGELKTVTAAKHMAEAQVGDLQQRILDLQKLRAAASAGLFGCAGTPTRELQAEAAMEEERQAMGAELEELHQAVVDRDTELLALNRELTELTDRLPREIHEREEAVKQVRQWLDQAQGQLQNTQTALTVKEKECRELSEQLEAQKTSSSALQAALEAARAREAELEGQREAMAGEMQARVASVMDLMKTTRLSLSQKLLRSQATCEALAQELAAKELAARVAPDPPKAEADPPKAEATKGISTNSSSSSFEGFPRRAKQIEHKHQHPKPKWENVDPKSADSGRMLGAQLLREVGLNQPEVQTRSPYWFAKSQ